MQDLSLKTAIIIPSRFNSSRFPGKALEMIGEYNVIQSVYQKAIKVKSAEKVIVATDDRRILESIMSIGGHAEMTSESHENGTSRIAEIAENLTNFDCIINVQGDEPFFEPSDIDKMISEMKQSNHPITSLMKRVREKEVKDPHCVKVVVDKNGMSLYFSRSIIPFQRGQVENSVYYKHIGIYGFRRDTLLQIVNLEPTSLERIEDLEQLRWLENGYKIKMLETQNESLGIDIPEDLVNARKFMALLS